MLGHRNGHSKILIVEDEFIIAKDLASRVERLGHEVCGLIRSGESAIVQVEKNPPDLILMDISLEGNIDGIEAARQIYSDHQIPVIFVSSLVDGEVLERAKSTLPFGYLVKPFSDRDLKVALELALYKAWAEKERRQAREEMDLNHRRMEALYELSRMGGAPEKAICDFVLEQGANLTKSQYGYLAFILDDESIQHIHGWSEKTMADCRIAEPLRDYEISKGGLWRETVRRRKPLVINDYKEPNPLKKGLPEGHLNLVRYMSVPVIESDKVVAMACLANKAEDYTDTDVRQIQLLVDGMWRMIRQKRDQEELRDRENTLSSLLRTAPVGIGLVVEREIKWVNQRMCEIVGYTPEELIGKNARLLYPDDEEYQRVGDVKYRQISKKGTGTVNTRLQRKDGGIRDIELSSSPIDPFDLKAGVTFTALDITDAKKAKENRRDLESQLAQARKLEAVGSLAGGIAHDFNNILGAIFGFVDLTLINMSEDDPNRSNLMAIRKASLRARDLVQRILTFSRRHPQKFSPVDISQVVKEAISMLRSTIPSSIEIQTEILAQDTKVMADSNQIHQILVNLCTNASQAMMEYGGILTVRLEASKGPKGAETDSYLALTVQDTGPGMDKDVRRQVFDPYFSTKPVGKGSGMGLAVVHGIVKNHGGEIKVDSSPGEGAIFTVWLPALKEAAPSPERPAPTGRETILVVDDEPALAELGAKMLAKLGYQVEAYTDSREALASFRKLPQKYHLVLTDQTMPFLMGADLARELLKINPNIPIILTSGYSDMINDDIARSIGIREFLMKPVSMANLAETVRNILDS